VGSRGNTVTCDVGQNENFDEIERRAKMLGVKKHYLLDVKEELVRDYIFKAIKANALYEGYYPLHSALHRYLIVKKVVEIARKEKADAIAHGNTGLGNDQMRYDITFKTYAPDLEDIAPIRELNMTRDQEVEYCIKNGIPLPRPKDKPYSIDENIYGRFVGDYGDAEDPTVPTPEDVFGLIDRNSTRSPLRLTINFENGVPVGINGETMNPVDLIQYVGEIAASYGYGWIDFTETTVVGTKIRQTYECPAAFTLIKAHMDLEKLVLTKRELKFKHLVDIKWAELVYDGLWVDPLREALEAFIDKTQERVTGDVTLEFRPNMVMPIARKSPFSLYRKDLVTYGPESSVRQIMGKHFTELWGAGSLVSYYVLQERRAKKDYKSE